MTTARRYRPPLAPLEWRWVRRLLFVNKTLNRLKMKRMKRTKMRPVFVFFCVYAAFQGPAYSAVALVKVQMKRL